MVKVKYFVSFRGAGGPMQKGVRVVGQHSYVNQ